MEISVPALDKVGLSFQDLLGEMMYAHVKCRPDIVYAITFLSKFGSCPLEYHYSCLKNVARYLRATNNWGIQFCRPAKNLDSKLSKSEPPEDHLQADKLPSYRETIAAGKLIGFVDAAYVNDLTK